MQRLAEDLYLLSGFPRCAINQYLAGDVLIDAGSRHAAGRILRELKDGRIRERMPPALINSLIGQVFPGPPHPVARRLREGDTVAGFQLLDTPGHSAGHVSFWRESDRTLICGDVFTNMDTITGLPGLREPKSFFTPDPARNRQSMRRLAELEPALVCFGHGRPLRDPARLRDFVARLRD
ncbi:MAG TPA: MBL fold metallo-hydrolase [Solirubrobacteraceae bacterium]|nr:MBL fold metallo-hydrolase [Solirubrobacteraceae bacterium]